MNVDLQTFPPVFIQAVPWLQERVKNVKKLTERLDGHDVTIVWDKERSGFATFNEAQREMADHPEGPTYGSILLEDDCVLSNHWESSIAEALSTYPGTVINFFEFRDPPAKGPREFEGRTFGGNVCVYYPPGFPQAYLDWVAGTRRGTYQENYHDLNYGRFLHSRKVNYVQWEPAPVQHLPFTSAVMPNRSKKRQSKSFRME